MPAVFTHLALHVADIDATIEFYGAFCNMGVVHRREMEGDCGRVAWLAEPGRERELIMVLISGGPARPEIPRDYSHLGFALESEQAVDALALRGEQAGCLAWKPQRAPYPVGYYCALRDPDGQFVEFSHGQPLGPGAEELDQALIGSAGGYGQRGAD